MVVDDAAMLCEKKAAFNHKITYMCFPGCPALYTFKWCERQEKTGDVRCSAELRADLKVVVTESTVMLTIVACTTIVVAFMQHTANAKKVTR